MIFGTGTNSSAVDAGIVHGEQKKITCEYWFTTKGKINPLMVKLEDEDGEIQVIREIMVYSKTKKRYAGIPSIEYDCTLVNKRRRIRAWLIFIRQRDGGY